MPAVIPAGIDTGIAADIFCPRRYPRVSPRAVGGITAGIAADIFYPPALPRAFGGIVAGKIFDCSRLSAAMPAAIPPTSDTLRRYCRGQYLRSVSPALHRIRSLISTFEPVKSFIHVSVHFFEWNNVWATLLDHIKMGQLR
jgi:hypothetical protein